DRLEDIVALVALYRPGPMANIPLYCSVKHGEQAADYIHPLMEPVLKETFGVIIYQEQVMQIAQILSGYSLGEADLLRRAMGKKIKAEMDAQRDRFVRGAVERGIAQAKANEIFDLLAKFADYGFNKSHAAAYALIAYQTGWFKANHPVEFLAASMTLDKGNTDKLAEFRNEARRLGIKVEPPSLNRSGVDFEVQPDGQGGWAIRYALSAVKGVGEGQAQSLVAARGDRPFRDLGDFARRINPREVNKKVLESLACAGAFDELEPDRARALAAIETILAVANRTAAEAAAGQSGLFGGMGEPEPLKLPRPASWAPSERLRREFEAVGFFLSGHPLDDYESVLKRLRVERWVDFARAVKKGASAARLAATVLDRQERRTKTGNKMGIVTFSDASGQYEAILFQEGLNQYRDLLEKGSVVLVTVQANVEGEDVRARIVGVEPLDKAASKVQKGLRIFVRDEAPLPSLTQRLGARGEGEVSLVVIIERERSEVEVKLPGRYAVSPQIAGAIKAIPGVVAVEHL
ncbi:MAG TPA: DNA polymerase III subunit alpha, partial [Beijerinckiaceae bacterium]